MRSTVTNECYAAMTSSDGPTDIDFSARDITILKARIKYPTASVRELRDVLESEYDISLSHNRVNDILREFKSDSLYQFSATLNEAMFKQYFFQVSFHSPEFENRWEECYTDLVRDPHVIMFFTADRYYQWQFVTQFRTEEDSNEWRNDFFQRNGDIIAEMDRTALKDINKFGMDAAILDDILTEREGGSEYLDSTR